MPDIARLYARRWDIELAFLTLKEHLGLHHWWSSQLILILQQLWVVLIIAQLMQAFRLELASQAGVDPFEVSLPLLIKYVPRLIQQRCDPRAWLATYGKQLGFIRPSTRFQVSAPDIALELMTFRAPDLVLTRKAHYVEYKPRPARGSTKKQRPEAPKSKKIPALIQLTLFPI